MFNPLYDFTKLAADSQRAWLRMMGIALGASDAGPLEQRAVAETTADEPRVSERPAARTPKAPQSHGKQGGRRTRRR